MSLFIIWAGIGLLVGLIFAFTGAGGAMMSIPLFILLADKSLFEATQLALFAVLFGSLLNGIVQFKNAILPISLTLAGFSFLASMFWGLYKSQIPEWALFALYAAVCLNALREIWFKKKFFSEEEAPLEMNFSFFKKVSLTGLLQGTLITLSGLGGGLIIMPLLLGVLKVKPERAVPTSLFAITLAACGSIFSQRESMIQIFDAPLIACLAIGILTTAIASKKAMSLMPSSTLSWIRTSLFSGLIVLSVFSIAIKRGLLTMS